MPRSASLSSGTGCCSANNDDMLMWLPENLPTIPGNGERPARIAYVCNLISTRPYGDNRPFVTLHSRTAREAISRRAWEYTRSFLDPHINIDHHYSVGHHSKGYQWNEGLRNGKFVPTTFNCPIFAQGIQKQLAHRRNEYGPIERQVDRDMGLLKTSVKDAPEFLRELPPNPRTKDEGLRRAAFEHNLHSYSTSNLGRIHRDRTGRLHCIVTRTPGIIRSTLTIGEDSTVEIDLANSQPYFLASIFTDIPNLIQAVSEGRFYAILNQNLDTPFDLANPRDYGEFKRHSLMFLYKHPINGQRWWDNPESPVGKIIKAANLAFPGLPQRLEDYSSQYGETALPLELQRRESSIFIETVLPRLNQLGIAAVPIHDGYLCSARDAKDVVQTLDDALMQATGIPPCIKISQNEPT